LKFSSFQYEPPRGDVRVQISNRKDRWLSAKELTTEKPESGSLLEVSQRTNEIYVGGAVLKPGFVPYNPNHNIAHYISQAGLTPSSKISGKTIIIRNGSEPEVISDFKIKPEPDDVIIVKENLEKKFTTWAPIILSIASISFAIITLSLQ